MDFKQFLTKILKENGRMNDEHVSQILKGDNMLRFRSAFTDSAYEMPEKETEELIRKNIPLNYEFYETVGDLAINFVIVNNINQRLPLYRSTAWLTRLRHYMVEGKTFAKIAYKYHFGDYMRLNDFVVQNHKTYKNGADVQT